MLHRNAQCWGCNVWLTNAARIPHEIELLRLIRSVRKNKLTCCVQQRHRMLPTRRNNKNGGYGLKAQRVNVHQQNHKKFAVNNKQQMRNGIHDRVQQKITIINVMENQ